MRRKLAAGNWKMNGTGADLAEIDALVAAHPDPVSEVLICPPATLLSRMAARLAGTGVAVGGQTCHTAASGAHTGDVSADMLAEAGAAYVILGHSERRADHGEDDATVAAQARAARAAGLVPIVCVGETEAQRDAGVTLEVIGAQVAGSVPEGLDGASLVVAYEPVWAIGTGRTATPAQIGQVHAALRAALRARLGAGGAGVRLLYGGSVKAANAAEIFAVPEVDGALVGGAALTAAAFGPIVAALDAAAAAG